MRRLRGMTASLMLNQLDYRSATLVARAVEDSGPDARIIRGTAIVFERWQRVAESDQRATSGSSGKREKIVADAVRIPDLGSIANAAMDLALKATFREIRGQVNHNPQRYLASMFKRSLRLNKTDESLDFEMTIPRTRDGDDVLAILENDGGELPASVGFLSRGRKSNIKKINFSDEALEEAIAKATDERAVEEVTPMDSTEINLQEGRLDGSDFVEGVATKAGRQWRVYKSFDLREISLLIGVDPAWQGVSAQLGTGKPQQTPITQARRSRELDMVRLRCSVG